MKHIHNLKTNIAPLMKGRRLTAFFLSVLMILTVLPTTVYAASVGSISTDKSVGKDIVQNASTTYENVEPKDTDTDVYLTVDNGAIVVGVPTVVIVNGEADSNGVCKGSYSVSVSGDMSGSNTLIVEPESTQVSLSQTGKRNVTASIEQTQTEFTVDDLNANTVTNGTISATGLSAGSWNGEFMFNIQLDTIEWYDITGILDMENNGDEGNWNNFGAYTPSTNHYSINIPVRAGEKYRISGIVYGSDELALVKTCLGRNLPQYTLDGIPAIGVDGSGRVTEQVITIPDGGKWLCLAVAKCYLYAYKVEKYGNDIVDVSKDYTDETMSWDFDKVYMTITIDDANDNLDEIVALSDKYSVPFNYAIIPSRLGAPVNNGEIKRDLLLQAQANGSEILAHDIAWMTSASSYDDYYKYYVTNKKTLEDNGFIVKGVIQSGGVDYGTQDFELATKLAYQAGYLYGDEISSYDIYNKRFYNRRIFNDNLTLDQWKAEIDKVADKGSGWINIGTHCYGNVLMDIAQLEEIVKYAQERGIEITTWGNLYDICAVNK